LIRLWLEKVNDEFVSSYNIIFDKLFSKFSKIIVKIYSPKCKKTEIYDSSFLVSSEAILDP